MTPGPVRHAVLALTTVLVVGCSSEGPDDARPSASPAASTSSAQPSGSPAETRAACRSVVESLLDTVQQYVDQYAESVSGPAGTDRQLDQDASAPDLPGEIQAAQKRLQSLRCQASEAGRQLADGLAEVTADGPVALAVKDQISASLTGRVPSSPTTVEVGTDDDIRDVLPELAAGSTMRLSAGRHRLTEPLVLLRGVRIVGAGRERTTILSSAADTALLALSPQRVDLVDLGLRHVGRRPASLVVGSSSTRLSLDGVALAGAREKQRGSSKGLVGGTALSLSGEPGEGSETSLEITDSVFRDNDVAGVLLGGSHVASIRSSTFAGSGQCAVCFTGQSSGEVSGSRFRRGTAAVIATDTASTVVAGTTIRDVGTGVQASERSTVVVQGTQVPGARRVALLFTDRSRGRVEGVSCPDSEAGIAVGPKALPYVGRNRCQVVPTR